MIHLIIPWIIGIVVCLQITGFTLAKRQTTNVHGFLEYMVRYNMFMGAAAFYLVAILLLAFALPLAFKPSAPIYYMISASLALAGIALPVKLYNHFKKRQKDG